MKQTLLSFVFAISTFTFGQYEKGNTVVVWTKLKYKESLEGVEGVSPDDWRKSFNEIYQKTNKADNLLKSSLVLSHYWTCLLYTSPSPRDLSTSRMPSSA